LTGAALLISGASVALAILVSVLNVIKLSRNLVLQ
jgi:hypothetical protein